MAASLSALLLALSALLLPAQPAEAGGFQGPVFEKMRASQMAQEPSAPPPAVLPAPRPAPAPPAKSSGANGPIRTVSSTAYCLTGRMANGSPASYGSVAMNGVPLGSRWAVLSGPLAGRVLVVRDRIGHSSGFDVAMPGNCRAAINYGRRTVQIRRVG